uniref:CRC domain-containing protein n=2 Tax=Rhizophora mucronata TaxID=61149 RepID=A0A2P2JIN9_RHIMU
MDTPEKTQIVTPLSKFEDSPVFNYISSLSPIKPVKSIHITQTFHSLSLASLPSIFTSPHVRSHKESRFLVRHSHSDPLRPESSSEDGNNVSSNEGAVYASQLFDNSTELQENFDPVASFAEASAETSNEEMKFTIELPQTLKFDCGSPDCGPTAHCGTQSDCEPSQKISAEGEMQLQGMHQIEQKKEAIECQWESLISDAADLLIFNSPMETEAFQGLFQKSLDHGSGLPSSLDKGYNPIGSAEHIEMEGASTKPADGIETMETNLTEENFCTEFGEKMDNEEQLPLSCKVFSNLHRGMRRRCLDFELVGACKRNLNDGSGSNSSIVMQSDKKNSSKEKQLVPIKPGADSSRRVLPGIGLHLNALALTSKDSKNVNHETSTTGIRLTGSVASLHSPATIKELDERLAPAYVEKDMDPTENAALSAQDVPRESSYLTNNEELNPSSPKKKRRRLEGETEACKRCNCKKSKCLKLYCECFAAGVYCIEPCSCQDCFNKPIHEETVLGTRKQIESRNPLAFAPKVIRSSESVPEIGDETNKTPASARHKRGCNCKKSNCLKKYCECYQGGVGCSINCRCEGCKNVFGRKDGSVPMEKEAVAVAEDETEEHENGGVEKTSQKTDIQSNGGQNPNSTVPRTPLRLCRSLVQLPLSSMSKPPRPFLGLGSSSGQYTGQKYGKPSILHSQAKFDKQFPVPPDDDMPEMLRGSYSPTTGIKARSPNSKRISPPHANLGLSPTRRSGRKLILQSIPSFPSLTPPTSK